MSGFLVGISIVSYASEVKCWEDNVYEWSEGEKSDSSFSAIMVCEVETDSMNVNYVRRALIESIRNNSVEFENDPKDSNGYLFSEKQTLYGVPHHTKNKLSIFTWKSSSVMVSVLGGLIDEKQRARTSLSYEPSIDGEIKVVRLRVQRQIYPRKPVFTNSERFKAKMLDRVKKETEVILEVNKKILENLM